MLNTLETSAANDTTSVDCTSIDSIITAVYDIVSGPAGTPRNWKRANTLFVPGARLVAGTPMPNGEIAFEVFDIDGYAASRAPYFAEHSFYETEVERRVEQCGPMALAFSSYESRVDPAAPPFMRGTNAIHLLHANHRWWIVSVTWHHEPCEELPEFLLRREQPR